MYESIDCDCVDGDGAWETVSKTRRTKDKMKIDQRAAAPVKKPGTKPVKTSGTAGTRRQNKKGNANMPGKKPAPLMNWREAAKKKADTTEMQKRVLLKNVQISRSVKNLSSRGVVGGENMTGKGKAAEKSKFDSFQEYNELFPNLSRCEGTEEESAAIQTHSVQNYANVPPFYDLNGCDVTADVLRILNEAFMGDPGNLSTPNQSTSHEHIQFMRPQQEYQVEDDLIDNSGLIDNSRYTNKSYGDCIGEMDTVNSNILPSDVSIGGEVKNVTREDLLNIPVDRAEPNIVEVQSTGEQQQELKVSNLQQDVNLHTQNSLQYKSIAEKIVFDQKKENALIGRVQDSLLDTDKGNVTSIKIKKKRRKRVKIQNKNKDEERMPINVNRQGNPDMQEDYMKKSYRSDQEVTTGANQIASDSGDLIEKWPIKVTKAIKLAANIAPERTTGLDACGQNPDKDFSALESASMDSLASAVSKLNISQIDSKKICKSDNQNNNCQEAGIDDDDSCLDLTGLESKCNPDYFGTLTKVHNQTDQEPTTNKHSDTKQADDSGLMQGPDEGECPGVTQLLLDSTMNTENKEFADSEEVKVEIKDLPTAFTDKGIAKTDITECKGGKVFQENRKDDAESNKDSAENDAVRIFQPCKDTPERQGKCTGKQGDAQEPIAGTKVTYGDVIEYVMEHLRELYAGKDIDRFNPVTRIEHAPLPDELTKHLSLLRKLSYNYTPSLHLYDGVRRECFESSDNDISYSFDNSSEDVGEKKDERSGNVDKDGEQVPLRRFHQKLQLFAQLNHLHQVVSNPCLAAFLEDWKLQEISEQFTSDVSDLFPDLIEGSKQTDESDLRNAAYGIENMESPRDASYAFESGGQDNVPPLSFDYGQVIEAVENHMSSLYLARSGMEPKEKEQIVQTPGPKESALRNSAALIFPEKDVQGSPERSKEGAEDALKSLISSPRGSCDEGFQFFQHSFLSSSENVSDAANDSLQNNSGLVGAVTAKCDQSTLLGNVRRFLWSQLTDIKVSLDREILGLKRASSCQKEHEERAWQGGDMTGTSRQEEEGTGITNEVTDEVTTDVTIDDEDLLGKGWMDRTLLDNLDNPKDEGPSEKRNRRDYRAKKFKALPFWWMP